MASSVSVQARPTVALVGFLDTKGAENAFVYELLKNSGLDVLVVDVSITNDAYEHEKLATHPPSVVHTAVPNQDPTKRLRDIPRTEALKILTEGVTRILLDLERRGQLHAVLACGGSTTTALACEAMRALPIGLPKMCVSTMASGDVSSYVGDSDICLTPAIVDLPGYLNALSQKILSNAAAAVAGMARGYRETRAVRADQNTPRKKTIALSMFGVTTPGVTLACEKLAKYKDPHTGEQQYETVVFHCTGAGGRSMERLIREKWFDGVLDLTTTELVDEHCGGVLSAGPTRLTAAGECGVPQVVSLGALDMCNFGPKDTVPEKYRNRKLHVHNSSVTLMRTTAEEAAAIGKTIGEHLRSARGPTALVIPTKGFSMLDTEGGPYWDPEADKALVSSLKKELDGSPVEVSEVDGGINDEPVVSAMVERLHAFLSTPV